MLDDCLAIILNYFQTCQLLTIRRVDRQFNKSVNMVINVRRIDMDIKKCVKFDDCHYFKSNCLSLKVSKRIMMKVLTESYDRKHLCIPKLVLQNMNNMTNRFGNTSMNQYLIDQIFLHETTDNAMLSANICGPQLSPEIVLEGLRNTVNHKNYNIERTMYIFARWKYYWLHANHNENYGLNPVTLSYLAENNHLEIFKMCDIRSLKIRFAYKLLSYFPISVQKFMGRHIGKSINFISDGMNAYFVPFIGFLNTAILFAGVLLIIGKKMNN